MTTAARLPAAISTSAAMRSVLLSLLSLCALLVAISALPSPVAAGPTSAPSKCPAGTHTQTLTAALAAPARGRSAH